MGFPEDTAIETKEEIHPALGREYFVFWRPKTESFWGFFHKTRAEAEVFLQTQIPDTHKDQFEVLKVRVVE
jgi:hypothetical protein